jgi:hypothetical protein
VKDYGWMSAYLQFKIFRVVQIFAFKYSRLFPRFSSPFTAFNFLHKLHYVILCALKKVHLLNGPWMLNNTEIRYPKRGACGALLSCRIDRFCILSCPE